MTGSSGAKPDVFVSYCRDDRNSVEVIVRAIEAEGLIVWWDARLEAGAAFDAEIATALRSAKCVLVCWSNRSIESEWVRAEALEGRERGVLIGCTLESCAPIPPFNILHHENLSDWRGDRTDPNWRRLVRAIARRRSGRALPQRPSFCTPRANPPNRPAWLAAIVALVLALPVIGLHATGGPGSHAEAEPSNAYHSEVSYGEAVLNPADDAQATLASEPSGPQIAPVPSDSEDVPATAATLEEDATEGVGEDVSGAAAHDSFPLVEDALSSDVSDPPVLNGTALDATIVEIGVEIGEQTRSRFEIGLSASGDSK